MRTTNKVSSTKVCPIDGTVAGDRIPGSKHFRAFCGGCGEAIRVRDRHLAVHGTPCCDDCTPKSIRSGLK